MADRIQHRRDTKARWAEYNPILLEGEVGYVTDNPNQYKIGDGVHAWNDLPFRGFDGTVTQETGNATDAVMSQKAVTEALKAVIGKVDLLDLMANKTPDEMGLSPTAGHSRYEVYYIFGDTINANVGTLDVFSDNMLHVLTTVFTTHFLLDDGNISSTHVDDKIFTYYRSWNYNAPNLDTEKTLGQSGRNIM